MNYSVIQIHYAINCLLKLTHSDSSYKAATPSLSPHQSTWSQYLSLCKPTVYSSAHPFSLRFSLFHLVHSQHTTYCGCRQTRCIETPTLSIQVVTFSLSSIAFRYVFSYKCGSCFDMIYYVTPTSPPKSLFLITPTHVTFQYCLMPLHSLCLHYQGLVAVNIFTHGCQALRTFIAVGHQLYSQETLNIHT